MLRDPMRRLVQEARRGVQLASVTPTVTSAGSNSTGLSRSAGCIASDGTFQKVGLVGITRIGEFRVGSGGAG